MQSIKEKQKKLEIGTIGLVQSLKQIKSGILKPKQIEYITNKSLIKNKKKKSKKTKKSKK